MNETREISVKSQLGTDILVRELRKDVFILDKWHFCKEARLVWYLWTDEIKEKALQIYMLIPDTMLLFSTSKNIGRWFSKATPYATYFQYSSAVLTWRFGDSVKLTLVFIAAVMNAAAVVVTGCVELNELRNVLQCKREVKQPTTGKQETPGPSFQFRQLIEQIVDGLALQTHRYFFTVSVESAAGGQAKSSSSVCRLLPPGICLTWKPKNCGEGSFECATAVNRKTKMRGNVVQYAKHFWVASSRSRILFF